MSLTPDSVPVARKGRAWETLQTVLALDPVEHADVGPYVLTGSYTNSSYLRLRGDVRAFGLSPFGLNILDAATVHSKNERIFLPAYIDGVEPDGPDRPRVRPRALTGRRRSNAMSTVGFYYQRPG